MAMMFHLLLQPTSANNRNIIREDNGGGGGVNFHNVDDSGERVVGRWLWIISKMLLLVVLNSFPETHTIL